MKWGGGGGKLTIADWSTHGHRHGRKETTPAPFRPASVRSGFTRARVVAQAHHALLRNVLVLEDLSQLLKLPTNEKKKDGLADLTCQPKGARARITLATRA